MDEGVDSSIWQRISKIFHGKSEESVASAIRHASEDGELDKEEGSMLLSVLTLDETQVQEIMTPRTDIICVPASAALPEIASLIIDSGHSRIPVYLENRDNIVGIVHAKDLLTTYVEGDEQHKLAENIMREAFFVPETKNLLTLLQEFRIRKTHLAIILDEYGGTTGLVTIEDLLEEIVGEIEDEHDAPREAEVALQPDGSYIVSGRAYLETLTEETKVTIESEEVDTLGGYICLIAGRLPQAGETFVLDNCTLSVLQADAKQVHSVRLTVPGNSPVSEDVPSEAQG